MIQLNVKMIICRFFLLRKFRGVDCTFIIVNWLLIYLVGVISEHLCLIWAIIVCYITRCIVCILNACWWWYSLVHVGPLLGSCDRSGQVVSFTLHTVLWGDRFTYNPMYCQVDRSNMNKPLFLTCFVGQFIVIYADAE
jgi:hypothetical protein